MFLFVKPLLYRRWSCSEVWHLPTVWLPVFVSNITFGVLTGRFIIPYEMGMLFVVQPWTISLPESSVIVAVKELAALLRVESLPTTI